MKKCLIIVGCVYVGYMFASGERENLISGVKVREIFSQTPNWVSHYQQNPSSFWELMQANRNTSFTLGNAYELPSILEEKNWKVNARTFREDYGRLLDSYRSTISEFAEEGSCCPSDAVRQAKIFLAAFAGNVIGHLAFGVTYQNCILAVPLSIGVPLWLLLRDKKMLKKRLFEGSDENLIATYKIVKKTCGIGLEGWCKQWE